MTTLPGDIPLDPAALAEQARRLAILAREEDLGTGDVSAAVLADAGDGTFRVVAKQAGVFAGAAIARTVLDVYDASIGLRFLDAGTDGTRLDADVTPVAELHGAVRAILSAERVLLNFLQRLCGIATLTRRYVDAIAGSGARLLDTRKTTPGWRLLEKYAVGCGGGGNHRMGLHDAVMIKDNHLAGVPVERTGAVVFEMLNRAAALDPPPRFVEIEADSLHQVEQLLDVVGVDVILCDNFSLTALRDAVALRAARNLADRVKLEASGGITLATIAEVAATGVDFISVGALTHAATALDLSLERID